MDVLQAPVRIVGDFEPEHFLELLVPARRQIGHLELAFDQLHLDLETQNDVQIVGDLVGFHADERRRDAIHPGADLRRGKLV